MPRLLILLAAALLAGALAMSPAWAVGADSSPLDGTPAYRQAKLLLEVGDHATAIPLLRGLLREHPGSADLLNLLGFAHRRSGDLPAAKGYYEGALKANPRHRGALSYQGEYFVQSGDIARAKGNLAKLQALCGQCGEAQVLARSIAAAEGRR